MGVSMPSRAWVVIRSSSRSFTAWTRFNALSGLYLISTPDKNSKSPLAELCQYPPGLIPHFYEEEVIRTSLRWIRVSMPSRAWVVTARMSNILNFLWYFLCIPAIYKCILAYLSIFFNQLSEFLRCESPNTFLGTCLSHHSFIILLITSTSALLTGL